MFLKNSNFQKLSIRTQICKKCPWKDKQLILEKCIQYWNCAKFLIHFSIYSSFPNSYFFKFIYLNFNFLRPPTTDFPITLTTFFFYVVLIFVDPVYLKPFSYPLTIWTILVLCPISFFYNFYSLCFWGHFSVEVFMSAIEKRIWMYIDV